MNKDYLQNYIEEHIPIVKEMKFKIIEINENDVIVEAPYREHINHRDSVFGGSISSLMTLAGWAKVRVIMEKIDNKATIVIQESQVKFIKPVLNDFVAFTNTGEEIDIAKYEKMYNKFGKTRMNIKVLLKEKDKNDVLAEFIGTFVVVKS